MGYWFVTGDSVSNAEVQNKVMFFLWDSVFATSKKPLADLLKLKESDLVTFGEFASYTSAFVNALRSL